MLLKHIIFSQNSFGEQEDLPCCFNTLGETFALTRRIYRYKYGYGTRCQTRVSPKIIVWTWLKKDDTPTFFARRDHLRSLRKNLTLSTIYF